MMRISRAAFAVAFIPSLLPAQTTPRLDAGRNLLASVSFEPGELSYAAFDPDGGIAVVDDQNGRIYRFRADGTFRDAIARTGDGPGEFRTAAGIVIGPAGEIAVADLRSRRVVFWGADGKSLGQATIPSGFPVAMAGWDGGPVLALTDFQRTLSFAVVPMRGAVRPLGSIPIAAPGGPLSDRVGCDLCATLPLPGGSRLVGATRDSTYRLLEFSGAGAVVRQWRRPPVRPLALTDEQLRDRVGNSALMSGAESRASGGTANRPDLEKFRYPPRITGLARDGQGRVWVRAQHDGPGTSFDVFMPSSQFIGMITVAQPIDGFAIAGTQLVAWGETDEGEPALWLYRIVP